MAASVPIGVIAYPWLPATVVEFVQLRDAPVPAWATDSFRESRERKLRQLESELALYILGTASLGGLAALAAKILPAFAEIPIWILTAVTGLGVSEFQRPFIGAKTSPTYILLMIWVPMGIAAVAALEAVIGMALLLMWREPKNAERNT